MANFYKQFWLLSLITIHTLFCSAQNRVNGYVTSENGERVEFAIVKIMSSDSSYIAHAMTDSIGFYDISEFNINDGILQISAFGYIPQTIPFHILTNPTIKNFFLQPQSNQLKEVTITGNNIIRSKDGHLIALPTKSEKRHSFGGIDLLANIMIPGITVDRISGAVSAVFGEAALYINGIKASIPEVKALRVADIVKIEYYDTPTNQYVGENAVINYVVKQYNSGGFGNINAQQNIGFLGGNYGFSGKIAHNNTTIQAFGDYNISQMESDRKDGYINYNFKEGHYKEQIVGIDGKSRTNNGSIHIDVTNTTKARTLQGGIYLSNSDASSNTVEKQPDNSYQNKNSSDRINYIATKLYTRFILVKKQTLDINLNGSYAYNKYSYEFDNFSSNYQTRTSNDLWNLDLTTTYTIKFNSNNSLAAKFINLYKNNKAQYSGSNIPSSELWSNEEIFFVQYSHKVSDKVRISFQPGISALQYQQKLGDKISTFSPRLDTRLTVNLPQGQYIVTSCNIGNSFPNIASLTTAEQPVNNLHVIRGNPYIDNTKLYKLMTIYGKNTNKFGLQAIAQYQYNHHIPISSYVQEDNVIIESWSTDEDAHYFNSFVSFSYRPIKTVTLQLSGGYNLYNYTGVQSAKTHGLDCKLDFIYYYHNVALNAFINTPQKVMGMDLARVETPWKYGARINYNIGQWLIEIGINNPFLKGNKYGFKSYNQIYNYNYKLTSRSAGCSGFIKLAFNFEFGKHIKRSEIEKQKIEIENTILKVH